MTAIGNVPIANNNPSPAPQVNPVGTTHIAFVLDESGSMASIHSETVLEFNRQIATIKEEFKSLPTKVSLIYFNSVVTEKYFDAELPSLSVLKDSDYNPNGWTAMNDAIGYTITKLKESPDYNDPNTAYLLIIVTDGQENHSRKYTGPQISALIKELKATERWTFTLLGANLDLEALTSSLSLDRGNVQAFAATSQGVSDASGMVTKGLKEYSTRRSTGERSTKGFYSKD